MTNYKTLTPNQDLFFAPNIWDDQQLATYMDAIESGDRIKLDIIKKDDACFVQLAKADKDEPMIQEYITYGQLEFFRRKITNYAQISLLTP